MKMIQVLLIYVPVPKFMKRKYLKRQKVFPYNHRQSELRLIMVIERMGVPLIALLFVLLPSSRVITKSTDRAAGG